MQWLQGHCQPHTPGRSVPCTEDRRPFCKSGRWTEVHKTWIVVCLSTGSLGRVESLSGISLHWFSHVLTEMAETPSWYSPLSSVSQFSSFLAAIIDSWSSSRHHSPMSCSDQIKLLFVITGTSNNGVERPTAYASRTLTRAKKGYAQLEKEALSLIYGVKTFHQFLYGRRFTLVTDHKPLLTILGPRHIHHSVSTYNIGLSLQW